MTNQWTYIKEPGVLSILLGLVLIGLICVGAVIATPYLIVRNLIHER